ncbi:MAG: GNAT family N-acetyltransferase [Bacteroidota bacterium]|jgi:ribosomal-protein-alanine N-acetyltransferase
MKIEFKLRPWNYGDLENLVKYANNWNVAKNMTDKFPFPYSESDGRAFLEFSIKDNLDQLFAIEIDGQAVGSIGIHPQDGIQRKNAELGYWLAEPFWGKGVISNAVKQVVDFAFNTYDINRVFARTFGTNLASQKVLEKNGFILEGRFEKVIIKHNEYLDELIYAIRR